MVKERSKNYKEGNAEGEKSLPRKSKSKGKNTDKKESKEKTMKSCPEKEAV